ncbi:alpha/beta fold hydrolase [Nocardia sp. NPDC003963]
MTHYRTVSVHGHDIFYREAGDPGDPTLLLLHGFPTSSHMFRDLIPQLEDSFHLVAPDHLGFGYSAMPSTEEFDYTFADLARLTEEFLGVIGVTSFAVYVQDYGAPLAWHIALHTPERISAIITQNGNAYTEGLIPEFWDGLLSYADNPTPDTEAPVRAALSLDSTIWQYTHGVADTSLVSPDARLHAQDRLDRPGNTDIQLALFRDYPSNIALYPAVHEYFRQSRVPVLAIWGENDPIFGADGALAFAQDTVNGEVRLLPTGHFALETHHRVIADEIRRFLADRLEVRR